MLCSLISQQPGTDQTYLYAKDSYQAKYQFLIYKRESTELMHLNNLKDFYWILEWYVHKNIEYSPNKKRKILIAFCDMLSNDKLNPIVAELLIRGKKLNTSLLFIRKSYFAVLKKH